MKINYLFSNNWNLQYSLIDHKIERNSPGYYIDDEFAAPQTRENLTRTDHTLNFFGKIFNSHVENFRFALYHSQQNSKLKNLDPNQTIFKNSSYQGLNFTFKFNRNFYRAKFQADFEHGKVKATDFGNKTINKLHFSVEQSLIHHKNWNTDLNLSTGWQSNFSPQFYGSLSENFVPNKLWNFSIAGSRHVRFPVPLELFAKSPIIGKTTLSPEIIDQIALRVKFVGDRKINFLLNSYIRNVKDDISYQINDSTFIFCNIPDYTYFGADLGTSISINKNFQIGATAMLFHGCQANHLPDIALKSAIKFMDTYFDGDLDVLISFESEYIGKRNSEVFHPLLPVKKTIDLDPIIVLNLLANLKFGDLQFYFLLENILDIEYEIIYGYPMNPRSFHYGIRWNFWD